MDTLAKILVVDDEAAIVETLKEVLEYESYAVQTSTCASDALKLLENEDFDVVISDIKMPDVDGLELLGKIREIRDVPVIMVTGHGDIETAVTSLKSGAFDFITNNKGRNSSSASSIVISSTSFILTSFRYAGI